jgi:cytoskeletal protein CcmA (bactofilin family)
MKVWATITILVVATLGIFGIHHTVQAADYRSNDNVTVGGDEVIQDDLFVAGTNLQIDGIVEGDVYAAGEQIIVNGQIDGDLIVAGSTITVNGDIGGSIRAVGQNLNISNADIGGGVSFFGSSMILGSESSIGNGLVFFGESLTVNGSIQHGIAGYGSRVSINGSVGTNSSISAETLRIDENAVIAGNIEYRSNDEAVIADGAEVAGDVTRTGELERFAINWQVGQSVFTLWSYLAALFVGIVLLFMARRPLADTATVVQTRPFASFGIGLLGMLLVFPLGLVFLATVIGIPLAILLWIAFGVVLYLSKFFVGIALGRAIVSLLTGKGAPRLFVSFFVGLSALYILNLIPVLTVLVSLIIGALGLGAVILRVFNGVRNQHVAPTKK